MTVVVDASAIVAALIDTGPDGQWVEALLTADLAADLRVRGRRRRR